MAPPAAVAVPCGVSAVQRQWQPRGQTRFHHAPRLPSHGISGRGAAPPRPFKLNSQFGTPPPPLFAPPLQRSQRWPFARASTHLPAGSVGGPPRPTQQIAAPRPLPPPLGVAPRQRDVPLHAIPSRFGGGGGGGRPTSGRPRPKPPPQLVGSARWWGRARPLRSGGTRQWRHPPGGWCVPAPALPVTAVRCATRGGRGRRHNWEGRGEQGLLARGVTRWWRGGGGAVAHADAPPRDVGAEAGVRRGQGCALATATPAGWRLRQGLAAGAVVGRRCIGERRGQRTPTPPAAVRVARGRALDIRDGLEGRPPPTAAAATPSRGREWGAWPSAPARAAVADATAAAVAH